MAGFDALSTLNLTPHQLLYSGDTVSVYSGTYQNYEVVFKVLQLIPEVDPQIFEGECQRMRSAQHENVVQLYNYYWSRTARGTFLVLILEACDKDLSKDMKQRSDSGYPYSEKQLWDMMVTLVRAYAYMQRLGLAHRDIKPDNIFLSHGTLKIGDFGSSRNSLADQMTATLVGTPIYLSPLLRQGLISHQQRITHNVFKSDVYSLGLTLIALATLQAPTFVLMDEAADIRSEVLALNYGEDIKRLILWMLDPEEAKRPDFVEMDQWIAHTYYSPPLQAAPQSFEIQPNLPAPGGVYEDVKIDVEPRQELVYSAGSARAIQGDVRARHSSEYGQQIPNSQPYRANPVPLSQQPAPPTYPSDSLQSPLLRNQSYYSNPCCLYCKKEVERTPSLVQLKCDPHSHVFCSVHCFTEDLQRQSPPFKCALCQSPIEQNDLEGYCVERTGFRAWLWRVLGAVACCNAHKDNE